MVLIGSLARSPLTTSGYDNYPYSHSLSLSLSLPLPLALSPLSLSLQCDRLSATRAFISQLPERRHMIIGPGCSSGAVTVAEISPFYNLTQVDMSAAHLLTHHV